MKKYNANTDNKTENTNRFKRTLKCSICPPNKACNAKRKAKHGPKKK